MKRKIMSLFLLFCLAVSASADSTFDNPMDTTQLMAWLTAGISGNRLIELVHERGLAIVPLLLLAKHRGQCKMKGCILGVESQRRSQLDFRPYGIGYSWRFRQPAATLLGQEFPRRG
jgi:hypothetical protein